MLPNSIFYLIIVSNRIPFQNSWPYQRMDQIAENRCYRDCNIRSGYEFPVDFTAAITYLYFVLVDANKDSPTYGFITSTPKPGWGNTDVLGLLGFFLLYILITGHKLLIQNCSM